LASALRAATAVVQNLRRKGPFALITFDEAAEVVIPMGPVSNQPAVLDRIDPAALSAALPDGVVGRGHEVRALAAWLASAAVVRFQPSCVSGSLVNCS